MDNENNDISNKGAGKRKGVKPAVRGTCIHPKKHGQNPSPAPPNLLSPQQRKFVKRYLATGGVQNSM